MASLAGARDGLVTCACRRAGNTIAINAAGTRRIEISLEVVMAGDGVRALAVSQWPGAESRALSTSVVYVSDMSSHSQVSR
jgi:hypothetical protein